MPGASGCKSSGIRPNVPGFCHSTKVKAQQALWSARAKWVQLAEQRTILSWKNWDRHSYLWTICCRNQSWKAQERRRDSSYIFDKCQHRRIKASESEIQILHVPDRQHHRLYDAEALIPDKTFMHSTYSVAAQTTEVFVYWDLTQFSLVGICPAVHFCIFIPG